MNAMFDVGWPSFTPAMPDRRECLFDTPTVFKSLAYRCGRKADEFGPFRKRSSLCSTYQPSCASTTASLNPWKRPLTITRLIVAIVVNSVKRMLHRRPRTHITQKCTEVLSPGITYLDSAATVDGITGSLRIIAAFFHAGPYDVFGRFGEAMCAIWRRLTSARMASQESGLFLSRDFTATACAKIHGC